MRTAGARLSCLSPVLWLIACGGEPSFSGPASTHSAHSALVFYTTPPAGLVGSYAGDVDGSDGALGHHGSLIGGATIGAGQVGGGFHFDGQAAGVQVPHHADFNFGTESFTIETWVRVDPSVVARQYLGLLGKLDASGRGFTFFLGPPGQIGLQLANSSSDFDNHFSPAPTVRDGGWHHVAFTVDRVAGVSFFVDGTATEPAAQAYQVATDISNGGDLFLGRHWNNLSYSLAGGLDEVRIFRAYSWSIGAWGACSATCGLGGQTRSVFCQRSDRAVVADLLCPGPRPESSQGCTGTACTLATARDVVAGYAHTAVVTPDGTLWMAGYNYAGQLGDGTSTDRSLFVPVLSGVASAAGGYLHTFALRSDGTLWATGDNRFVQLGYGDLNGSRSFVEVLTGVSRVATGDYHTFSLKSDGTLWATGLNRFGQLGTGTTDATLWTQVLSSVVSIATGTGGDHGVALRSDGTVWTTGDNRFGQLGDGTTTERHVFAEVMSGAVGVAAGSLHTLVLKTDGTLWAAGYNADGQLGDGTTTSRSTFVQVLTGVSKVVANGRYSLAIKSDGTLWATGDNWFGQLGDGTSPFGRSSFIQVLSNVQSAAAGGYHTVAVRSDGSLWATGGNFNGQLGDGTTTNRSTFIRVY